MIVRIRSYEGKKIRRLVFLLPSDLPTSYLRPQTSDLRLLISDIWYLILTLAHPRETGFTPMKQIIGFIGQAFHRVNFRSLHITTMYHLWRHP